MSTTNNLLNKDVIGRRALWVTLTVLVILILDQMLKFWIKTNMELGEEFNILGLSWARIHFVENEGMAFGWKLFGGKIGKIALGVFRLVAIVFLFFVLRWLVKSAEKFGLIFCFALIFAGAIGNIIDTTIYGLIFSESTYHGEVAELFPEGGGYNTFLMGNVVDMFYFPMYKTTWPEWVPYFGGKRFEFFGPVFNVADAAISTGVISILVFHREIFKEDSKNKIQGSEEKKVKEETENIQKSSEGDSPQENVKDT